MAVLGLILVVVAAVVGADIVLENTGSTTGTLFNQTVSDLSLGGVFLAGAVTALVLALGLWLLFGSAARARRRRQEAKQQRREVVAEKDTLAAENARLAQELERARSRTGGNVESGSTAVER